MPGYFIDIGSDLPDEGDFEAPDDALVVVFEYSPSNVRGLISVRDIVEAVGETATASSVYEMVRELTREPETPRASRTIETIGDAVPMTATLLSFDRGTVVVEGGNVGIAPLLPFLDESAGAADLSGIVSEAMRAMGPLPGLPTTQPLLRNYVCGNGHPHSLPAGSGGVCPTVPCGLPLRQAD